MVKYHDTGKRTDCVVGLNSHKSLCSQLKNSDAKVSTRADQNTGSTLLGFPVRTAMHGKSRVSSAIKYDFLKLDDSGNCIIRKT